MFGRECTLKSRLAPLNYEPHPAANLYNRTATNLTAAKIPMCKKPAINNILISFFFNKSQCSLPSARFASSCDRTAFRLVAEPPTAAVMCKSLQYADPVLGAPDVTSCGRRNREVGFMSGSIGRNEGTCF